MKKLIFLVLVVVGISLMMGHQIESKELKVNEETGHSVTLGFEDSGSPKSFEDDWGG